MNQIELQKKKVNALLAERTAHHWDESVYAFEGDSPAFEDVVTNVRLSGSSGIAHAYRSLATALPDLEFEIVTETDTLGCSIREMMIVGTHQGSYQGHEATGRRVRVACACFFHFDSASRLTTERVYFDNETLLHQMRGRTQPYLPKPLRVAA